MARLVRDGEMSALRRFLLLFLPAALLVVAVAALLLSMRLQAADELLESRQRQRVLLHARVLASRLDQVASDLRYLASGHAFDNLNEVHRSELRDRIAHDFTAFLQHNPEYFKARFIETSGRELVRVNRSRQGHIHVLPEDSLQDKSHRYYVREGLRLAAGEVFFGPLDLNLEHGRITRPLLPTLRVVSRVAGRDGGLGGLVVLSYDGANLLRELGSAQADTAASFFLVNEEGYWLRGPSPELEWGWMLPERAQHRLAALYPAVARLAEQRGQGQVRGKEGLFTVRAFDPFAGQAAEAPMEAERGALTGNRRWVLVAHLPASLLRREAGGVVLRYGLGALAVLAVAAIVAAGVANDWRRRSRAEHKARQLGAALSALVQSAPVAILSVDREGRVIRWNPAARYIFGLREEEALGRRVDLLFEGGGGEKLANLVGEALGRGQRLEQELQLQRAEGGPVELHLWLSPLLDNGGTAELIVMAADMTERKRAREAERAGERLETARRMARTVAHEFRQPMTALNLVGDILSLGSSDPESLEASVVRIRKMLARMDSLVNRMLNITEVRFRPYLHQMELVDLEEERGEAQPIREAGEEREPGVN